MGPFTVSVQVRNPQWREFVEVETLVDTGASPTLLPLEVLTGLVVEAFERVSFQLADERIVEYDVGKARIRAGGRERTTPGVFGPQGAQPLLGATTSQLFSLAVDTVGERLLSVRGLLS